MPRTTQKPTTKRSDQSRTTDAPFTIKPVAEVNHPLSFVLYGRSGTGKTTLAASFPGPILFIDVKDQGTGSIVDSDADVTQVTEFQQFEEIYWWLEKRPKKYKTIVIDTVSQLQQIVVAETAADKNKKGDGKWGSLTRQDWGNISSTMKEWLINFRDLSELGMNVVFIAQDRSFNMDDAEDSTVEITPEIGPGLSPSIAKTLNAAVQMIGNTFIRTKEIEREVKGKKKKFERIEYCLRIGPNPVYVTKTRKPKSIEVPSVLVDPTYEALIQAIKGE